LDVLKLDFQGREEDGSLEGVPHQDGGEHGMGGERGAAPALDEELGSESRRVKMDGVPPELMAGLTVCNHFSSEERRYLLPYLEVMEVEKGTRLFSEGDAGDYLGVVVSGRLEVEKRTEFEGRQIIIAVLTRGAFVGELSLIDGQPRSATVRALEPTKLVILRREVLDELLHNHPAAGIAFLKGMNKILAIRLRKAVDRLAAIF